MVTKTALDITINRVNLHITRTFIQKWISGHDVQNAYGSEWSSGRTGINTVIMTVQNGGITILMHRIDPALSEMYISVMTIGSLSRWNISHFIGDTVLDLTKAQIPAGETRVHISSFIGDVKVFLPNDFEVGIHVVSSAFIGDVAVLDHKEGGIFKNMNIETPFYQDTDKKVTLVVSTFIGDVRVTKVG